MTKTKTFDFVVVANRLPVDRVVDDHGDTSWRRSPGGLVTAMDSVMRGRDGAWVGWAGDTGEAPDAFDQDGLFLRPVPLTAADVENYYEGFSNDTLWPIYHDVIVPASFHRHWWQAYRLVNQRFADAAAEVAAEKATVWVHDYQLQLVPSMLRRTRPDLRIGWFNHIPFPPVELFAQLPWRRPILEGLLGADYLGFQRVADAENFLRGCRRLLRLPTRGDTVTVPTGVSVEDRRTIRASAIPISIDFRGLAELARSPDVAARAKEIRESLGQPDVVLLGVDRLDYTKGIGQRLQAYEELLHDGALDPAKVVLVQVATPSRERVAAYQRLRTEIEATVGRINGDFGGIGSAAVNYLHHSYPVEEMAALYLVADVMLVTPLRDGMNLVAKEYVTCRYENTGALVLSEFTGAWNELHQAYICNPRDVEGLKQTIMSAIHAPEAEKRRRMRALRRRVSAHDVQRWATRYLAALAAAPEPPSQGGEGSAGTNRSDHSTTSVTSELYAALSRLAKVPAVLVAADFDGTLAPLVTDPMAARAVAGGIDALNRLAGLDGVTAALVSGRDLDTLAALSGIAGDGASSAVPVLVGSHGAHTSRQAADRSLDAETAKLLADLGAGVSALAADHGARVEHKPTSVVVHTRGQPGGDRDATLRAAADLAGRHTGVFVTPGKEVLELAVVDTSKGKAVRELAASVGATATAYFGDDVTDETAFRALTGPDDVTVKVGEGPTAARYRLPDERAVVAALVHLADARRAPH